jgi:uncharacterized protein (DUF488 family)
MGYFTVGYGGRAPKDLVALLQQHQVRVVVDVRLRPDRASMGIYSLAKTPDKGIAGLLQGGGIEYLSLIELGNVFLDVADWQARYQTLLQQSGELLCQRLILRKEQPLALMCAEKEPTQCHRAQVAQYLHTRHGWEFQHLV